MKLHSSQSVALDSPMILTALQSSLAVKPISFENSKMLDIICYSMLVKIIATVKQGPKELHSLASRLFNAFVQASGALLLVSNTQAQNLFAVDESGSSVYEFTPGGMQNVFATGLDHPLTLAFNSAGNLFVASGSAGDNNIVEIRPDGTQSVFTSVPQPIALACNSAGNLFVSEYNGTIKEITPDGTQSTFASGLPVSEALTFDNSGNLFVGELRSSKIVEFTPEGTQSTFASISSPYSLAFDNSGDLFVGNGSRISEIKPDGTQSIFASGLTSAVGLVFDNDGNLFASDYTSGNIYKFTPDGLRTTFASGFGRPAGLAIQPAPEPSALEFLIISVIAVLPRRRR